MVFAVVVTYNRLDLLKQVVEAIQQQTHPVQKIIIVNNDSTDGTKEWLDKRSDLFVIHQSNAGGSGGFHTGVKTAFEQGAAWIWMMDDDILPENNCLQSLLDYKNISECINPIHFDTEGEILDEDRYFDITSCKISSNFNQSYINGKDVWFRNVGHFEGMLISRAIVEKIGFPDPRFFITHDDLVYGYLASKYTNVAVVKSAVMKKLPVGRTEKSHYNYLYYYHRNLWLLAEYAAKDLAGFEGYRNRRILKQFLYAGYKILKTKDYKSKTTALRYLYKAFVDYRKKKTGKSV